MAILQAGGGSKESSEEDSEPECQNGPIQVAYFIILSVIILIMLCLWLIGKSSSFFTNVNIDQD
jgi:hypothetical protein